MNTLQENDGETRPDDEALQSEAAAWLFRLSETDVDPDDPYPDPETRNAAFFDWVSQSKRHLHIFMEMLDLECRLHKLGADSVVESDILSGLAIRPHTADLNPVGDRPQITASTARTKKPRARRRFVIAAVVASAAAAGAAAVTFLSVRTVFIERTNYVTDVGQRQDLTLSDGTTMLLNTGTDVDIFMTNHERNVYLNQGEAFLKVTPDPKRVFTLYTDDAYAKVLGTELDARKSPDGLKLAIASGTVKAGPRSVRNEPDSRPIRKATESSTSDENETQLLSAGQAATISSGKVHITGANLKAVLAWRDGRLVFTETPLVDVVEEFNRYNKTQMRVEGTHAKRTRVTGGYPTDGFDNILTFARSKSYLSVFQDGTVWVIKSKE
jgi:transmembrane sensor